jgi:alkanesulfonate monooxygenase SsuD/methylene tetrahydromethanopterin reductase-like flavin-dependent oxidoreductase (luciferase family)
MSEVAELRQAEAIVVKPRVAAGIWSLQSIVRRPTNHARLYMELLEDAELVENLGIDSIWLSEHHVWYDGYCPSMVPAAAAILARTERLVVGTAIMQLPLHPFLKVADELRLLHELSGGRFELGVGLGYRDNEFDAYGLRRRDRGRLMNNGLEVLLGELETDGGGRPPISVAVASQVAARRAGRFGLPMFADSTLNPAELAECWRAYREAAEEAGRDIPSGQVLQRDVWVTDDPERDRRMLIPELVGMRHQYGGWSVPPLPSETPRDYFERLAPDVEAKLGNLIMGTPREVSHELEEFVEMGFEILVCRTQFGNIPRPDLHRSLSGLGAVAELLTP